MFFKKALDCCIVCGDKYENMGGYRVTSNSKIYPVCKCCRMAEEAGTLDIEEQIYIKTKGKSHR